ncbi:MAG: hypothetical protein BroJett024_28100 [Alphaproteobacteria bacterium]|nr:MAG: hypothetical protein BroJett024_28100 [Alphaproteobacteria bacterium]
MGDPEGDLGDAGGPRRPFVAGSLFDNAAFVKNDGAAARAGAQNHDPPGVNPV